MVIPIKSRMEKDMVKCTVFCGQIPITLVFNDIFKRGKKLRISIETDILNLKLL